MRSLDYLFTTWCGYLAVVGVVHVPRAGAWVAPTTAVRRHATRCRTAWLSTRRNDSYSRAAPQPQQQQLLQPPGLLRAVASGDEQDSTSAPPPPPSSSSESSSLPLTPSASQTPTVGVKGMEQAWRYAKKPLLSIGAKGATLSHGNSLRQLLEQHTVVKVKVNTRRFDGSLTTAFEELRVLAQESGAPEGIELLQAREADKIILFGWPGTLQRILEGQFPVPPVGDADDDDDDNNNNSKEGN